MEQSDSPLGRVLVLLRSLDRLGRLALFGGSLGHVGEFGLQAGHEFAHISGNWRRVEAGKRGEKWVDHIAVAWEGRFRRFVRGSVAVRYVIGEGSVGQKWCERRASSGGGFGGSEQCAASGGFDGAQRGVVEFQVEP